MSNLNKMDVANRIYELNNKVQALGRLHGAYTNFFIGTNEVDQADLQGIEVIVNELERMIADAQTKVEEIFALSEKVRGSKTQHR